MRKFIGGTISVVAFIAVELISHWSVLDPTLQALQGSGASGSLIAKIILSPIFAVVLGIAALTLFWQGISEIREGDKDKESLFFATDLWLGYDSNILCIQNKGREPIFNVIVSIPEDGSELKSDPIGRLEADGKSAYCALSKAQVQDATDNILLGKKWLRGIVKDNRGMVKEATIPIRISYTDISEKLRKWDGLEIALPFRESSIQRRTRRSVFHRLRFPRRQV